MGTKCSSLFSEMSVARPYFEPAELIQLFKGYLRLILTLSFSLWNFCVCVLHILSTSSLIQIDCIRYLVHLQRVPFVILPFRQCCTYLMLCYRVTALPVVGYCPVNKASNPQPFALSQTMCCGTRFTPRLFTCRSHPLDKQMCWL